METLDTTKLLLLAVVWRRQQRKRKQRSMWIRPIFVRRKQLGAFWNLFQELKHEDPMLFFNFTRMNVECFEFIHKLVYSRLEKCVLARDPISPEERLAITIRYLASGDSMASMSYMFRLSRSSITYIIRECCAAIWDVLSPIVFPELSIQTWKRIAEDFEDSWNFPNCLGAIDGKHVVIQAPPCSGSLYYNYKKEHSMVILGISDSNYRFTAVDIEAYGHQSDSNIFHNCSFGKNILDGTLDIPSPAIPKTGGPSLPYVFVADEAFPLKPNIMRPYPGRNTGRLSTKQRIFNYRLSRARMLVEQLFGVWSSRWRILRRPIVSDVRTVEAIIKCTVCLHNYVQENCRTLYCPPEYVDREINGTIVPGAWRNEAPCFRDLPTAAGHNAMRLAYRFREMFTDYFVEEGEVEWQLDTINRTN